MPKRKPRKPIKTQHALAPVVPVESPSPEALLASAAAFLQAPAEEEKQYIPAAVIEAQLEAENAALEKLLAKMQACTEMQARECAALQQSIQQNTQEMLQAQEEDIKRTAKHETALAKLHKNKTHLSEKITKTESMFAPLREKAAQDTGVLQKTRSIAEIQNRFLFELERNIALLQTREKELHAESAAAEKKESIHSKRKRLERQRTVLKALCTGEDTKRAGLEVAIQQAEQDILDRKIAMQEKEQEWRERGIFPAVQVACESYSETFQQLVEASLEDQQEVQKFGRLIQHFLKLLSAEGRQEIDLRFAQSMVKKNVVQMFQRKGIEIAPEVEKDPEALLCLTVQHRHEDCFLHLLALGLDKRGQAMSDNVALLEKAMQIAQNNKAENMMDLIQCANALECRSKRPPLSLMDETLSFLAEASVASAGKKGVGNVFSKFAIEAGENDMYVGMSNT